MNRLLVFVSSTQELEVFQSKYSRYNLVFASSSSLGGSAIAINGDDPGETLSVFRKLHAESHFTGIVNRRERFVIPAALAASALGLQPLVKNPCLFRDKYLMKNVLHKRKLCEPAVLIQNNEMPHFPPERFPCVLKPRFGVNSMGVVRFDEPKKLACELRRQRRLLRLVASDFPRYDLPNFDFILEPYIGGSEHSVDTLFMSADPVVQIVSDKAAMKPPYFIELGDVMPTRLRQPDRKKVCDAVVEACRALSMENGWAHTEVKLHEGRAHVMEVAGRMGGGYFEHMVREVYEIDMTDMLVKLITDGSIQNLDTPRRTVVGRRIVTYGAGVAWKVSGVREAVTDRHFRLLDLAVPNGKPRFVLGPPYNYFNTLVEFFVLHDNAARALELAKDIFSSIPVRIISIPGATFYVWLFCKKLMKIYNRLAKYLRILIAKTSSFDLGYKNVSKRSKY